MGNFILEDGSSMRMDKGKRMEKVLSIFHKSTIIKDSFSMVRKMGQGLWFTLMAISIRGNGKKAKSMASEFFIKNQLK